MKASLLLVSLLLSVSVHARPVHIGAKDDNKIIDPAPIAKVDWRVVGAPTVDRGFDKGSTVEDWIVRGENNPTAEIVRIAVNPSEEIVRELSPEDIKPTFLDSEEYDPAAPGVEAFLNAIDAELEAAGETAYPTGFTVDRGDIDPALTAVGTALEGLIAPAAGCVRQSCAVWAHVNKRTQRVTIYVNGSPIALPSNLVSTGAPGHGTPNFDKHPDGRIYTKYSSRKFPGGDWNGLGNMPYAVFIRGGYAMHGTPSIGRLGSVASHGCIRMHPYTAKLFNGLVRQYGVANTWITVN